MSGYSFKHLPHYCCHCAQDNVVLREDVIMSSFMFVVNGFEACYSRDYELSIHRCLRRHSSILHCPSILRPVQDNEDEAVSDLN